MKLATYIICLLFIVFTSGCDSSYTDGEYCAEVEYYNPNTGTRSSYTLKVELEAQYLIKMYWPNGGWIDDSDFDPPVINEYGKCDFKTNAGYHYEVKIKGQAGDSDCFDEEDQWEENPYTDNQ